MPVERMKELRRRRARRQKLALLRRLYQQAKSAEEKAKLLAKANRISPGIRFD
jgi:hypothetical protein